MEKLSKESIAKNVAEFQMSTGAVKLQPDNPFTWASGWKSPIYCDNRLLQSNVFYRNELKLYMAQTIIDEFPDVDVIISVATGAIWIGVLAADKLDKPHAYVRPDPKGHGTKKQVEGYIAPGSKVVIVEDLISTGSSTLKATLAVQKECKDVKVLGVAALFTYGFAVAEKKFNSHGLPLVTLSEYTTLLAFAEQLNVSDKNHLSVEQRNVLAQWRLDPEHWGLDEYEKLVKSQKQ